MNIIEVLGLLAGSTLLSSLAVGIFERRKKQADAADIITKIALSMVEPLNERIGKLDECIFRLEQESILKNRKILDLEASGENKDRRILELELEVERLKRKIVVLEESR